MLFLLAGSGGAWGQQLPPLARPVVLPPGWHTLGGVLAALSRQSHVPFSYSSSLVPVAHRYRAYPGPARPLGIVLREVLAAEHLAYGLLDGQLVLWPAPAASSVVVEGRPVSAAQWEEVGAAPPEASVLRQPRRAAQPIKRSSLAKQAGRSLTTAPGAALPARKASAIPAKAGRTPRHPAGQRPLAAGGQAPAAAPASSSTGKTRLLAGSHPEAATVLRSRRRAPALLAPTTPAVSLAVPATLAPVPVAAAPAPAAASAGNAGSRLGAALAGLASLPRPGYLHGEAWGSESLPLSAAVKAGFRPGYLLLGAAVGPFNGPDQWAWGIGIGTAGRPRGRFTPSLDLVQWFLVNDGEEAVSRERLTQLRPQLAWQLKAGRRWQLVAGPTLNLATAHRPDGRARWAFGQEQWLWRESADEETIWRLWPGVQVGVRF